VFVLMRKDNVSSNEDNGCPLQEKAKGVEHWIAVLFGAHRFLPSVRDRSPRWLSEPPFNRSGAAFWPFGVSRHSPDPARCEGNILPFARR
jgi:hypothetical protein